LKAAALLMTAAEAPAERAPITPAERTMLVLSLSTRAQLDEIERININAARAWAMGASTLRRSDLLTEAFSRELHRRMFNRIWRRAGRYRTTERDPGWEPGRIAEGVSLFFDDAEGWLRCSTFSVHEAALRLHHRLVSIHPWSNGNGRHARLVADIVVAANDEKPLSWGSRSPSDPKGTPQDRYRRSIAAAADGDFLPLLEFARG
jgi:Fic-DOC domain mobile mystery protein B